MREQREGGVRDGQEGERELERVRQGEEREGEEREGELREARERDGGDIKRGGRMGKGEINGRWKEGERKKETRSNSSTVKLIAHHLLQDDAAINSAISGCLRFSWQCLHVQ